MDIKKERTELIEMFGVHFENVHNLPPLASRILGLLILDACKDGITFDALIEHVAASKSSVSTSLNLLLKLGKITYYTLPGDRKKYFMPSPISERITNYVKMIEHEKEIINRIRTYRENTACSIEEKYNIAHLKEYERHVLLMESLLHETILKFKEIEKNK